MLLRAALLVTALTLGACAPSERPREAALPAPALPAQSAVMIASDPTWGNTEGPAFDSKGTLFFCARGTFKGIVAWTEKEGARRHVAIDAINGPGGLWIDDQDQIFVTGPGERKVWKVTPARKISVLASGFEADPKQARGPNDLVVAPNKSVYFTDPNGFYGDAPAGTVYRLTPEGKVSVFDNTIVGPNGITISQDGKTLIIAGNVAKSTSKITKILLQEDGSAGARSELATIENCVADGMDVDSAGRVWLACYSFGTAYRIGPEGRIEEILTTAQKALTNCFFGRGADQMNLYLTSSDMERVTGYVYKAKVSTPGFR